MELSVSEVKVLALMGCYAAYVCNFFTTFWDNLSVQFSRVKQ
jgi:hypothetical protein